MKLSLAFKLAPAWRVGVKRIGYRAAVDLVKLSGSLLLIFLGICSSAWSRTDILIGNPMTSSILRFNGASFVETFANIGAPQGMAMGPDGNLYICDGFQGRVIRYNITTGVFDDFIPAGTISNPTAIKFYSDGNIYVLSGNKSKIHRFNATTGAALGLAVDTVPTRINAGKDFVMMAGSGDFLVVSNTNTGSRFDYTTGAFLGYFLNTTADNTVLRSTLAIILGPDGRYWVSSSQLNRITRFDATSGAKFDDLINGNGLNVPGRIEILNGNLYVANAGTNSILQYSASTGAPLGTYVAAGAEGLAGPRYFIFAPINSAPVARAGNDFTVLGRSQVSLDGSASSDLESDPLTYTWTQTQGPGVTITNPLAAQAGFIAPEVPVAGDAVTFSLTVSDGVRSSTDSVTISITGYDSDNDGMPNAWESAHGLNPGDPSDANLDSDGDGMSNLAEYLAGTDPQNASSRFQITNLQREASGTADITFSSVPGKLYQLVSKDVLTSANPWTVLLDNIPATGSSTTVMDPSAVGVGQRFYKISVK